MNRADRLASVAAIELLARLADLTTINADLLAFVKA